MNLATEAAKKKESPTFLISQLSVGNYKPIMKNMGVATNKKTI
jgi:hypothetical protein